MTFDVREARAEDVEDVTDVLKHTDFFETGISDWRNATAHPRPLR